MTQTGLESPAEVTARTSIAPVASVSSAEGGAARTRDSRSASGSRRQPSSDETPAQKPSSLSVPPGALIESNSRRRARRFLAIAALVLGAVILVKQVVTSGDAVTATAEHRVDAEPEPKQVEKALAPKALAPERVAPERLAPERKAAAGQPAAGARASELAPPAASAAAPATPAPNPNRVAAGTAPSPPAAGPATVAPATSAPLNVEASAKETVDAVGVAPATLAPKVPPPPATAVPSAPAALEAPSAVRPAAPAPAPAPVATKPALPAPKPMPPAAKAPTSSDVAPVPVTHEPRPFDAALATQQFQAAAAKASACGQQGTTRGTGRIKVAIEPWGRVGRVTHLNPDFVGTPVGSCVMQAFQGIRVPPFDGNSRSLEGDFVVE